MPAALPERLSKIAATGHIGPEDTLAIRRIVYPDGVIGPDEAEWLFALNAAATSQDKSWHILFVEALTDYAVHQMQPDGYVTPENASWLMDHISHDGHIETHTELKLLVNILEEAKSAPAELSVYAMAEIKRAILDQGRVSAEDAALLRRVLYATGGQQNIAINRAEAEVLFDIHDEVHSAENDASWHDLFVKAVANHIMFASGYAVPHREEALRREAWLDTPQANVSGFFARMAGGLKDVIGLYTAPDAAEQRETSRRIDISVAERVSEDEATWLASRILKSGKVEGPEAALLAFIRDESPDIHPALKQVLDKVA